MVHVDLENLLLGEQAFDLQRKQHLVDFASKCFLRRQIEIARDLHRDRRCALGAARLAEVGQPGADHAHVVDAAVVVELRVLGGEHRVLHHLRDLADRHEVAPLLAELAQQHAVGGEHAHRQLRPVVGEAADLGEVGIGDGERDAAHENHRDDRGGGEAEQPRDDAQQRPSPRRAAPLRSARCVRRDRCLRCWIRSHAGLHRGLIIGTGAVRTTSRGLRRTVDRKGSRMCEIWGSAKPLSQASVQRGFACEICNAHEGGAWVFALVIKGFTASIEVTY